MSEPRDRLDALDRERFESMLDSPPFRLYHARIAMELERARADCERHDDEHEMWRAQGKAKALRVVLELPLAMLAEMKQK